VNQKFSKVFYRPIVFQEIERAVWPPSWLGHAPFALWLMDALRPQTVVELGSHTGNSFAAFCQGAKLLDYSPSCYAVDTWEGDPHAGSYSEEVFLDVSQYFSKLYGSFSHLLRMTFNEALKNFSDGSIDLLNIDGYHTYEATKENFDSWLPKMSARGVILIHDTNVHTADFGAWKFWEEIANKYPSFNFLHSHGLGVVFVGNEIEEPIKLLTRAKSIEQAEIRSFFSALGSIPTSRAEKDKLAETVEDLKSSLVAALAWVEFGNEHIAPTVEEASKKLESLQEASVEGLPYKLFVQRFLGVSAAEAEQNLDKERKESQAWKDFVQGSLGEDIQIARARLEELGRSSLEGLDYKRFLQRHLAPTIEEAEAKLEELGRSNLEGLDYKRFLQRHLAPSMEEAEAKLEELGRSNLEGLDYKRFLQCHLAPSIEEASNKLEVLSRMNLEGIQYRLFVQNELGEDIEKARAELTRLRQKA